jgi:hypothetical protein
VLLDIIIDILGHRECLLMYIPFDPQSGPGEHTAVSIAAAVEYAPVSGIMEAQPYA